MWFTEAHKTLDFFTSHALTLIAHFETLMKHKQEPKHRDIFQFAQIIHCFYVLLL